MAFAAPCRGPTATLVGLQIRPGALPRELNEAEPGWLPANASLDAAIPD